MGKQYLTLHVGNAKYKKGCYAKGSKVQFFFLLGGDGGGGNIQIMVIARSVFVVRTQRISCDIRNFVCREEKCSFSSCFFQST